jgi:hypothetical protein
METRLKIRLLAISVALGLSGAAHGQSIDELKRELEQSMRTIQDLQQRVNALEQQQKASAAAPAPAPAAAAPAGAVVVVAPNSAPEAGAPGADKARLEIYGHAMLDAIYDFNRMNPTWAATLRPSQIPVVCPGSPGCGKEESFMFSARQSTIGLRAFIPTAMGEIKTDLAADLFGTDGSTSIHWLRMWGELGQFGAGQTDSNFMDIDVFPNTIDYWGPPGMVFIRNPQLRYTPISGQGMTVAFSLEAPNSIIDTGKVTDVDPALGAGITAHNRLPDLTGSFRMDRDWGHFRAAGVLRQVGFQNTGSTDGSPSGTLSAYGVNLSGTLKLFAGKDKLSMQVARGTAIASYMNDGGIDLAPDANLKARTVDSWGWLAYYNHAWSDKLSSAIGYSEHDQENTAGQLGTAFKRGSYASTNLLYQFNKNLMSGVEYIWGNHETKDGSSASDNRLQFSTKYSF